MEKTSLKRFITGLIFLSVALTTVLILTIVGLSESEKYRTFSQTAIMRSLDGAADGINNADAALARYLCAGSAAARYEQAAKLDSAVAQSKLMLAYLPAKEEEFEQLFSLLSEISGRVFNAADNPDNQDVDYLTDAAEKLTALRLAAQEYLAGIAGAKRGKALASVLESRNCDFISELNSALSDQVRVQEGDGPFDNPAAQAWSSIKDFPFSGLSNDMFVSEGQKRIVSEYLQANNNAKSINAEEAEEMAVSFAEQRGYTRMIVRHLIEASDAYTLTLVREFNGIFYYNKLITVRIDARDARVVSFDESGYDNSESYSPSENVATRLEAQEVVSDLLAVEQCRVAVVPLRGDNELCYEFECRRWDGRRVYVFINAITLREEHIYFDGGR